MKFEMFVVAALATVVLIFTVVALKNIRRAFIVPEGYAGLLYHEGQFEETLAAGRHVRWGLNYTLSAVDFRKASLTVAGQEVLTSDGVGLKVSLLINYQMIDP